MTLKQESHQELLTRYQRWLEVNRNNGQTTVANAIVLTKQFLSWLANEKIEISQINQETIEEYISYCQNHYGVNSLSPITINLRKFCYHFLQKDVNIKVTSRKAPERDKTALTKEEIKLIFEAAKENPLEVAIIKVLYYTGLRRTEVVSLDMQDVDFNRKQITVKHGKGNTYRVVNMTQDCAEAIKEWLQVRPRPKKGYGDALFISSQKKRIYSNTIRGIVKRNVAKTGITKNVYPHLFRISMITHMAEEGLSPMEIQAQSGHSDLKTLLGYIQHSPSRIRSAYEKVFGDVSTINQPLERDSTVQSNFPNSDISYKQVAIKKYLDGEINAKILETILTGLDEQKVPKNNDPAYH